MVESFDDFMVHSRKVYHSSTSSDIDLGGGYTLLVKGNSPPRLKWELKFSGWKWYLKEDGTVDLDTKRTVNNFGRLLDFYNRHDITQEFIYNDPVHGKKLVRFQEPMTEPEVYPGSQGVLKDFQIDLIEVSE